MTISFLLHCIYPTISFNEIFLLFNASATELATLDRTLEPLLARVSERAAETEQLAMDATRLLSVRPDQLAIVVKQPFFKRL